MATYTVAEGERGVRAKTLAAGVEDIVNFSRDITSVEVLVQSGSAPVYFTSNRSVATVAGNHTDEVVPSSSVAVSVWTSGNSQIRLISAASCVYSVTDGS